MPKRAVVLGGGGARGPYHIGVWRALNELSIDYRIVTGSSVGAINGAFMVQGQYEAAKSMWESLTTRSVIAEAPEDDAAANMLNFFRQAAVKGGLDITPLEDLLRRAVDEEAVRRSPIEYGIVTTKVPNFEQVQLLKDDIPNGELVDYILASAACFPFFQRRDIGGVKYIDGGYTDNIPAELAVSCGAEEIVAVDLQALGVVRSYRHEEIPVTYIRSHWNLGVLLVFEIEKTKRNMSLGYQDAMKAFRRLEGKAYAFWPGETRRNTASLMAAFDKMRRRTGVSIFRDYEKIPKLLETFAVQDSSFIKLGREQYTLGHSVTTAAEITAELLEIQPDKIYSFGELNRSIYEKTRFLRESSADNISGPRLALKRMYRLLKRAYETEKLNDAFWGLAAVAPKSFVAVNYILALEIYIANL